MGNILDLYAEHKTYTKVGEILGVSRDTASRRIKKALLEYPAKLPSSQEPIKAYQILKPISRALKGFWSTDEHNDPSLPVTRFGWFGAYCTEVRADFYISTGDFDNFDSINAHAKNETFEGRLKPAFIQDLEHSALARGELNKNLKIDIPKFQVLGNHEHRIETWENKNPEDKGFHSFHYRKSIENLGWEITPYRKYKIIDNVAFTHVPQNGMKKPRGGENSARNVAKKASRDTCWGDSHKWETAIEVRDGDEDCKTDVRVINGGCAMPHGHKWDYAKDASNKWDYGVNILYIRDGKIDGWEWVTMRTLEEKYG